MTTTTAPTKLLWMDEPITAVPQPALYGIEVHGADAEAFLEELGAQFRELERLRAFHCRALGTMDFRAYLAIAPGQP